MSLEIQLLDHFGSFLADGNEGNKFRFCEIEPKLGLKQNVVFDFQGVENISDSFANACFGNLAEQHGEELFNLVQFKNCSPLIKEFVSFAISSGLRRHQLSHKH